MQGAAHGESFCFTEDDEYFLSLISTVSLLKRHLVCSSARWGDLGTLLTGLEESSPVSTASSLGAATLETLLVLFLHPCE